jgi:Carboxyl transferase domain
MHLTEPDQGTPALDARDYLEFVLDEAGSVDLIARPGLSCRKGTVDGRPVFAAALSSNGPGEPVLNREALADLARFVSSASADGHPLLVVLANPIVADSAFHACHDLCGQLALCRGKAAVISLVIGPCIGFAAIAATIADIVYCGPDVAITLADAEVARMVADVPHGTETAHASTVGSGVADVLFDSEVDALLGFRKLAGFLPSSDGLLWRVYDRADRQEPSLSRLVGSNADAPIDISRLLRKVVDDGDWIEMKRDFGRGLLTGLARLDGSVIGLLANASTERSGVLDGDELVKATCFIELCGWLQLPIITIVDSPGVLPGFATGGPVQAARTAALAAAMSRARVPVISLIVRRAFGAAFPTMVPAPSQRSRVFTWPTARVGATGTTTRSWSGGATVAPVDTRAALINALREIRDIGS